MPGPGRVKLCVLLTTSASLVVGAAIPAQAAKPKANTVFFDDLNGNAEGLGTVTLTTGASRDKFAKVVVQAVCPDGSRIKKVFRNVPVRDDGLWGKVQGDWQVGGDIHQANKINGTARNGTICDYGWLGGPFIAKPKK
jgi:hypothetical protein